MNEITIQVNKDTNLYQAVLAVNQIDPNALFVFADDGNNYGRKTVLLTPEGLKRLYRVVSEYPEWREGLLGEIKSIGLVKGTLLQFNPPWWPKKRPPKLGENKVYGVSGDPSAVNLWATATRSIIRIFTEYMK